ncbi:hypothetical protein PENANT_c041G02021 [Penicillium antarcticum]|uniref:Major facilitator superfamily (MFS) profile domain-containing protein n=1 Tax=Penicillium antarcticum TaxID=416450 RepID=A0A1V6PTG9_9EURO|nr:hypothetical protein PENANT_c041G02021 [Penicillium antarcticum]
MAKQEEDISIEITPSNNQNIYVSNGDSDDNLENQPSASSFQAGVHPADILRKSRTKQGLILFFTGLFLCTLAIKFADYSAQVFGRAEMFIVSILASALGYVIYAACANIALYMAAGIFEAIGSTGFALTQQVFVADMTSLANRGVWSMLPDSLTTIPTLCLGTIVAQHIFDHSTWRWGWGMWATVLPFASLPLIGTMFYYQRRAPSKVPISETLGWNLSDNWYTEVYRLLWIQVDLPGAILLVAGLSLLLVPVSLTGSNNSGAWTRGSFIAMLVLGVVFLVVLLLWDARFAKKPFVPYRMIKNRTVAAACLLGALNFFHYSVFRVFFTSYLQVAGNFSAGSATRIEHEPSIPSDDCMGNGRTGNEAAFVTAKSLIGIGRGFYQTAAQVSVQAMVSRQEVSVVSAVFFASMSMGSAVGTSVAGAIWRNSLPNRLQQYLPSELKNQAKSIFGSIEIARKYAVGTKARDAINRSYRESQRLLAIAGLVSLSLMLIDMLLLRNMKLGEDGGAQAEEKEQTPAAPAAKNEPENDRA